MSRPLTSRPRASRRPLRGRAAAFTLIEVLATLVLIGIVIPVAMRGVSLAMSVASSARHTAEAANLGEARLNECLATREWELGPSTGDFGPDWPAYRWELETAPGDYDNLTNIVLRVTWQQRGRDQSLSIATIAATLDDPAAAGAFGSGVLP